jgi:uncharacterized membrane protein YedE/YeeE
MIAPFLFGVIFGIGLTISQMTDPARVIGFLDLAGEWDATLLFVIGGALAVTGAWFPWVLRRREPILSEKFRLPTRNSLDPGLIVGAAIFGVGWGLAGFCPGPAIAALSTGFPGVFGFVGAMFAGQWLVARLE